MSANPSEEVRNGPDLTNTPTPVRAPQPPVRVLRKATIEVQSIATPVGLRYTAVFNGVELDKLPPLPAAEFIAALGQMVLDAVGRSTPQGPVIGRAKIEPG